MNDFTKEELKILYELSYAGMIDCNIKTALYKNLLRKIKSMIDNYCEHCFLTHPVKGFPLEREIKCNKCGIIK